MNSIPVPDPKALAERIPLKRTVPDPSNPPDGCNFHTCCPYATNICKSEEPLLERLDEQTNRFVACHWTEKLNLRGYGERVKDQQSSQEVSKES